MITQLNVNTQVEKTICWRLTWLSRLVTPLQSPPLSPRSLHLRQSALHWYCFDQNWALFSSWADEATSGAAPQKLEVSSACAPPLLQSARLSAPPDLPPPPPPPPSGACSRFVVKIMATCLNWDLFLKNWWFIGATCLCLGPKITYFTKSDSHPPKHYSALLHHNVLHKPDT